MHTYPSKIGLGILSFLIIVYGFVGYAMFKDSIDILSICFYVIVILPAFFILFSIRYIINGSQLLIKVGPFTYQKITIAQITKVKKSRDLMSAAAASTDRLAVYYNAYGYTLISPRRTSEFIAELQFINPKIEVDFNHQ